MTEQEKMEIMEALVTSPDFLQALAVCESQIPTSGEINLNEIAVWFFTQGYISRMEYKDSLKPYLHS